MAVRKRFGRIGVLMGGPSTEREISLKSGKAVFEVLKDAGFDVKAIDVTTDDPGANVELIRSAEIDCAFIALHGRFGEDGQIQLVLETLRIPYTGSGVLASRLAMDKISSRRIFEKSGIRVPRYKAYDRSSRNKAANDFGLPVVVKPATHGSSIGLSIVVKEEDFAAAVDLAFSYDDRIIVEEHIRGRELTVGILGGRALPVIEIIPKRDFFDFEAKYRAGMTDYIVPARLRWATASRARKAALSAHESLGCFGCSRVDIILGEGDIPYVLEVNTIPGLTSTSLLPKAAGSVGVGFRKLCLQLIKLAHEKKKRQ